jgi:hypothetical protein
LIEFRNREWLGLDLALRAALVASIQELLHLVPTRHQEEQAPNPSRHLNRVHIHISPFNFTVQFQRFSFSAFQRFRSGGRALSYRGIS